MEQLTGSKLRKEYDKAVYCHPDYLTYMQSMIYVQRVWSLMWAYATSLTMTSSSSSKRKKKSKTKRKK